MKKMKENKERTTLILGEDFKKNQLLFKFQDIQKKKIKWCFSMLMNRIERFRKKIALGTDLIDKI